MRLHISAPDMHAFVHVHTYECTVCMSVHWSGCICVIYVCVCVCAGLATGGKKRGFAFVQFTNVFSAGQAMEALNGTEIKGTPPLLRTVATAKTVSLIVVPERHLVVSAQWWACVRSPMELWPAVCLTLLLWPWAAVLRIRSASFDIHVVWHSFLLSLAIYAN